VQPLNISASKKGKIPAENINPFQFIDVFAGCGGLSLGLMQAGLKGLFAIEHEENAFQTLSHNLISETSKHHFKWPTWLPKTRHEVEELITKYSDNLKSLSGHVDLLVGGPPCQGFSSAGKRDANDPRNRLMEAYLKLVMLVTPKIVLIENVRGITDDFKDENSPTGKINYALWLIEALSENYNVSFQMINTSLFGVPQRRHRFIVLGIRKDISEKLNVDLFNLINKKRTSFLRSKGIFCLPVSAKSAISDLEVKRNGSQASKDTKGFQEIKYIKPTTEFQKAMHAGHSGEITDTRLARHKPNIAERFQKIINICHSSGRLNTSLTKEVRETFGLRKTAIRVLDPDSPSPTITSMPDDLLHYSEARTLTVRENARLQSFPDWFIFQGKYTTGGYRRKKEVPRFTQVANAVPPLLAEAIGMTLKNYLKQVSKLKITSNPVKDFQEVVEFSKDLI
jgi:DNA (cytosine-5)-methyltransferase 1